MARVRLVVVLADELAWDTYRHFYNNTDEATISVLKDFKVHVTSSGQGFSNTIS